jgi:4'-phosphopantetheinyl transferase
LAELEKISVSRRLAPTVTVREFQYDPEVLDFPVLPHDEIHLWHQSLTWGFAFIESCSDLLSPDELQRAGRFRFVHDREEFIVCRGTLRILLGYYLNLPPKGLLLGYSEFGRPSLAANPPERDLEFNVSHSGDLALLAFASGRKIGIDVERVRRNFGTSEIAERFFSEAERAALRELPHEQRRQAFFRCWTRKEAFIKALGEGLSHPLDQFDVSLAPATPAALLATRPDAQEAKRWMLWDIRVPNDYAAALAAESK